MIKWRNNAVAKAWRGNTAIRPRSTEYFYLLGILGVLIGCITLTLTISSETSPLVALIGISEVLAGGSWMRRAYSAGVFYTDEYLILRSGPGFSAPDSTISWEEVEGIGEYRDTTISEAHGETTLLTTAGQALSLGRLRPEDREQLAAAAMLYRKPPLAPRSPRSSDS